MHSAIRPYVTAGIALVGACAIAVTPIVATPPDLTVAEHAVDLTASPFDAYEALLNNSVTNIEGLASMALAPAPTLPFTLGDLISQVQEVDANVAAFRALVGGLSGQLDSLNQLNQMFQQAASTQYQAGNIDNALDIVLYASLFNATGLLGFALYPAALLGADVEEVTPEFAGALFNAAVAPAFSGVAVGGHIAQEVLDAVRSGEYQDLPNNLIAAPALLANGVLNGTSLQTVVFGNVAIPGILTDATLSDAEGPGPVSLAIEFAQFTRALVTPPAAAGSSNLDASRQTSRAATFDVRSPSAVADEAGNVVDADEVTNTGTVKPATPKRTNQARLLSTVPGQSDTGATGLKSVRDEVRGGIRGLRDGVRDVLKSLTGRGASAEAEKSADAEGDDAP